tara:strand:+ start:96 stop:491 length:396 start_codon:yes stop_codon:yes gene_type:complete
MGEIQMKSNVVTISVFMLSMVAMQVVLYSYDNVINNNDTTLDTAVSSESPQPIVMPENSSLSHVQQMKRAVVSRAHNALQQGNIELVVKILKNQTSAFSRSDMQKLLQNTLEQQQEYADLAQFLVGYLPRF